MSQRLGINKAEDQAQRIKLAYLAAPHSFNGQRDVWAIAHASEIVNPTTQVLTSRVLKPKHIDAALEEGRIISALQLYCLARYARAGMPQKERVRGFESLARYVDPDGSVVGPKYFLGLMSATQRVRMFELLLQQSCDIVSKMESNAYPHTVAAFNVTHDVLRSHKLSKMIHEARKKSKIKYGNMELELLEGIQPEEIPESAIEELKELSELGVHIAVDDLEPDTKYEHLRAQNSYAREMLDHLLLNGVKVDTVKIPGIAFILLP
jgi:EAL domain-containing protein (putative c-di-GMP-specific phosphodiesterase class I)